jgi:hypothetical protein
MLFNRDSTIQSIFRRFCTACKSEDFQFPVNRPDDLPSSPDAHLSIVPAIRTTYHTVRTPNRPSIIRPDDMDFHPDHPLYREASVPACIRPDVSAARPKDVRWSISFIFSFQVQIREDWCNRQDDVDFRPDALIHKARIAIQIQPSGRQSAWNGRTINRYGNCVFNFNHLDACLSWSGRVLNRYGNCVLKINRPDGHPPWSGRLKSYMEITCSGCATVRTTVPHLPDAALKQERFWVKNLRNSVAQLSVWTTSLLITAVAHLNPQPINRGLWPLRTVRIRYWIPSELRELFCEVIGANLFSLKPLQVCCCCAITEVYLRGRP